VRPASDLFQDVWRDHAPLVRRLTHKFPLYLTDELFSCGMIGLWQSWQKYDPTAGTSGLWGFAIPRVLGAMRDYLRGIDMSTRHERDTATQTGQEVTPRREVDVSRITLTCPRPDPVHVLAQQEIRHIIFENLLTLPPHLAELLHDHYFEEKKLADIGLKHGFTESRACQIKHVALDKLREILEDDPRLANTIRELT
jgi:RNA polymerase sigma factor (sigma-70 family)